MANITIRNIPDHIYETIKKRAAANRRSLNQELVSQLERNNQPKLETAADDLLAKIRATRKSLPRIDLTEAEVSEAKKLGRP